MSLDGFSKIESFRVGSPVNQPHNGILSTNKSPGFYQNWLQQVALCQRGARNTGFGVLLASLSNPLPWGTSKQHNPKWALCYLCYYDCPLVAGAHCKDGLSQSGGPSKTGFGCLLVSPKKLNDEGVVHREPLVLLGYITTTLFGPSRMAAYCWKSATQAGRHVSWKQLGGPLCVVGVWLPFP